MRHGKFFDEFFALHCELNVSETTVSLRFLPGDQFPLRQPINNVHGGMVLDLQSFAQLRDRKLGAKSFDCEKGFVLLGIKVAVFFQEILAEAQELSQQVAKTCERVVIVG